jgi:anti-anti-sigma factor
VSDDAGLSFRRFLSGIFTTSGGEVSNRAARKPFVKQRSLLLQLCLRNLRLRLAQDAGGVDISEDRKADFAILTLSGKLDATTAKTFEEKIVGTINSGMQRLVVDLSQLDYVSSSGLRVLLLAAKRLQATDGKMVLCGLQDHIRQVFDLAGFSSILSVYGSRDENRYSSCRRFDSCTLAQTM